LSSRSCSKLINDPSSVLKGSGMNFPIDLNIAKSSSTSLVSVDGKTWPLSRVERERWCTSQACTFC
jgi:hypothetical protein